MRLPNGVILTPNDDLTEWAKRKGLHNIRAFTTSLNTFLLVEDHTPIFESQILEDCAVHIDILALDKSV